MKGYRHIGLTVICIALSGMLLSGCAVNFYKQSPRGKKKIKELETKVDQLEKLRMQEQEHFEAVRRKLESRLKEQISNEDVSVRVGEGGLAIVLSDQILFDPGKAVVKKEAFPVLDKVTSIIVQELPEKNIGISGHTDNVPINVSGWESNWDLSTARATNVLYYLEKMGIEPQKLSATGYGEYRPVASNETASGRARNRRVEILILPEFSQKEYDDMNFARSK